MKYLNSEPTQLSVSRIITKAFLAFLLSTLMLQTAQATTPTLVWNNSNFEQLIGAKNVNVDGWLYDVYFVEGTCDFLWAGCDGNRFLFKDSTHATSASQALLDQVLIDVAPHIAPDSVPQLVFGIENPVLGGILTPFGNNIHSGDVIAQVAVNKFITEPDYLTDTMHDPLWDSTTSTTSVWAMWSVPEPSTFVLFAAGLASLGFVRRYKKA